ncbi:MAG: translation initiation factor IF-2 [Gemmatimonadetes bacterium]|nr:translation initiation factor IF-2 [Gemmatimonadota bacterium]
MAQKKVFEVAKQYSIPPAALLRQLKGMGSAATSPVSTLEPEILAELEKSEQAKLAARKKKTATRKTARKPAVAKSGENGKPKKPKKAAAVADAEPVEAEVTAPEVEAEQTAPAQVEPVSRPADEQAEIESSAVAAELAEEAVIDTPEARADDATAEVVDEQPEVADELPEVAVAEEAEAVEAVSGVAEEPVAEEPEAEEPAPAEAVAQGAESKDESAATVEEPKAEGADDADEPSSEVAAKQEPEEPEQRPTPKSIPQPKQTARILFRPTTPVAPTVPPAQQRRGGAQSGYRQGALPFESATHPDRPRTAASMAGAVSRRAEKKRKKRKAKGEKVDQKTVHASVRKTFAQLSKGDRRKKRKRDREQDEIEVTNEPRVIQMAEYATVSELAQALQVAENEIILKIFGLGVMATRNQRLEMDMISMIADEFGVSVQPLSEIGEDRFQDEEDDTEKLVARHPVVTVMGHVDHGKTSLLDQIRKTNVVKGEKGGITQHIGAYEVETPRGSITFMDTPGHEAFTAMRLRGAQVTDLVILVVAADDGVMPQTVEAIDHARAAKVPIVVAINKCDLPGADPLRVRQRLTEHNLVVEDFGGKVQAVEVSAKKGEGLDRLLETVLLEAEMLELKANPDRRAEGVVVEAYLDKGKGPVATVLVERGTLTVGDAVIAGLHTGKVRALLDERDKTMEKVGPASPAKLLGLSGVPQAGDTFHIMRDEREAREIASQRGAAKRTSELKRAKVSLDSFMSQAQDVELRELPIIVKGDVDGSVEALSDSLERLSNDEVRVEVIRRGVGGIAESDVMLAATSSAVILGFHVRPTDRARDLAAQEQVDIRLYDVIYDAVSDVRMALEGLLKPDIKEELDGTVEVREVFKVPKVGSIAGCYVLTGKVKRNGRVRVVRDDITIFESTIASLRRFKDDAKEVAEGFECGIGIERFNDVKIGDRLEVFSIREIARKLEVAQ